MFTIIVAVCVCTGHHQRSKLALLEDGEAHIIQQLKIQPFFFNYFVERDDINISVTCTLCSVNKTLSTAIPTFLLGSTFLSTVADFTMLQLY